MDSDEDRVERPGGAADEPKSFLPTENEVGYCFTDQYSPDQVTVGFVTVDRVTGSGPDAAGLVEPEAVMVTGRPTDFGSIIATSRSPPPRAIAPTGAEPPSWRDAQSD